MTAPAPVWLSAWLLLSWASAASAETSPVVLSFGGPGVRAGCPGEPELRERIESLATGPAFVAEGPRHVTVRVEEGPERLIAEVAVEVGGSPAGARRIETIPGDCPALMAALALSLVLVIDPVRGAVLAQVPQGPIEPRSAPSAPPPSPSAAPQPASEPPALTSSPPPPAPPPAAPFELALDVGPGLSAGTTPQLAPTFKADVWAGRGHLGGGLSLRSQWPRSGRRDGGTVESTSAALEPAVCARLDPAELCAVMLMGFLWVDGNGYTESSAHRLYLLHAGGRAAWVLGLFDDLALVASAELSTPLASNVVLVNGAAFWRSPPLAGTGVLAMRWAFRPASGR